MMDLGLAKLSVSNDVFVVFHKIIPRRRTPSRLRANEALVLDSWINYVGCFPFVRTG